jgi:hypothetical protein
MKTIHIAVTYVGGETHQRAIKALEAAGLQVHGAWIAETITPGPPSREHLVGKPVRVIFRNDTEPLEGTFMGQGPSGIAVALPGGGRLIFTHAQIKEVQPV